MYNNTAAELRRMDEQLALVTKRTVIQSDFIQQMADNQSRMAEQAIILSRQVQELTTILVSIMKKK